MANRIFSVQTNTDDLSAAQRLCLNSDDEAQLLRGYLYGAAGGDYRLDMPQRWRDGFLVGQAGYILAREFQAKQIEKGKLGGAARVANQAAAKPRPKPRPKPLLEPVPKPISINRDIDISREPENEKPINLPEQPQEDPPEKILACLQQRGCIMRIKGQDVSSEWNALLIDFPSSNGRLIFDTIKENGFRKPIWLSDVRDALEAKVSNQPGKSMYPNLNDSPPQPTQPPTNGAQ